MAKFYLSLILAIAPFVFIPKVSAQDISPDTTLPENTVVEITDEVSNITGGTVKGTNLFHSFLEFSLNPGDVAHFNNAIDIANILGRVTGGNPSAIDGLIEANGDANLFLINPAGIIFGKDAALDIGGTFTATTADSILFEDGEFNALNPNQTTLSINVPSGAQLGSEAPAVTVFGEGNGLFWDEFAETIHDERPEGLSNDGGINLIGGKININGGNVTSVEGKIDLIAAKGGRVNFGDRLTPNDAELGDVTLSNAGSASTTGEGSGTINAYGANLYVKDGSAILSQSQGEGPTGSINLNFSDTIEIIGESLEVEFPSYISTDVGFYSTTQGGDINVNAGNLNAFLGGQINAATFGEAPGGNLTINATNVLAESGGSISASAFLNESSGTEKAGDQTINADTITVNLGGQIGSTAYYTGDAGNVNLNAREINVVNLEDLGDGFVFASQIISNSFFEGKGGNININAEILNIADGGQILTSAFDFGDAGNININANTIDIRETYLNETGVDTGIISGSGNEFPTEDLLGKGGNIDITADTVNLVDGGLISNGSFSANDGGVITINADELNMFSDPNSETTFSGGRIQSLARSSGNSGVININTDSTLVEGGSQINVSTIGSGNGGTLNLNTDSLKIEGFAEDGASTLASVAIEDSGNGGSINVAAETIEIINGGTVTASNFPTRDETREPGTGAAGNIKIDADSLTISNTEPTTINTSTNEGGGGQIEINTNNVAINGTEAAVTAEALGTSDGGEIFINTGNLDLNGGSITTSATSSGNAGNIRINADEVNGNTGNIVAESQVSGGGEIFINSENIDLDNNSLISTSVEQSDGGGGNIAIDNSDLVLLRNNSDIRANAEFGPGGNIEIATELLFADFTSDIDASSTFGLDGIVEIDRGVEEPIETENLPDGIENPNKLVTAVCPITKDDSFAIVGKGGRSGAGIALNSEEIIGVPSTTNSTVKPEMIPVSKSTDSKPIKEANGIFTTPQGEVIIAHQSTAEALLSEPTWYQTASCSK